VDKAKSVMKQEVMDIFQLDCATLILNEMAENHPKAVVKGKEKCYCHHNLMHALQNKQPMLRHWGCQTLLDKLQRQPELLLVGHPKGERSALVQREVVQPA
jgi:hypothetical protein